MKVRTLSGIWVEANERDSQWIRWVRKHGAGSKSFNEFLKKFPPPSPTAEASDLKSDQCEFKSLGGDK